MPVGATLGAAGIGAVGSIAGGLIQKSATDSATAQQRDLFNTTRSDLAPYRAAGATGTNALLARLPDLTAPIKLDQAFVESTPGYQFNLTQGLKAVQNSAAARGLGTSGAALKGAANFATGLADSTYQQQFANELAQRDAAFNKLLGTANIGEGAAAQTGQFATQTGQSIGQNTVSGGTALAAGITGAGNSLTNGFNTVGGINYANQLLKSGYAPPGYVPANFYSPTVH